MNTERDAYIQWIEYSALMNVQELTSLRHGCTHAADWLDQTTNELTRVTLKRIVGEQYARSFDFYQVKRVNRINNFVFRVLFIITTMLFVHTQNS